MASFHNSGYLCKLGMSNLTVCISLSFTVALLFLPPSPTRGAKPRWGLELSPDPSSQASSMAS